MPETKPPGPTGAPLPAIATAPDAPNGPAEPVIARRSGPSLVWLVPLVALLVAGWLVYQSLAETGPAITVSFNNAPGLEAGKTKVRLKDVVVGNVESIALSPNLDRVLVKIRMQPDSTRLLVQGTRFWIVTPRITARAISGLNTLLSGPHIELDPGSGSGEVDFFEGLEAPPVVASDEPGTEFMLHAASLGSLGAGSPIYFRQIPVGYVIKYQLAKDGAEVDIQVFVSAPYDQLVHHNTHFWNASGITIEAGTQGIKVRTESLMAILGGGIAFDLPPGEPPGDAADPGHRFTLFSDRASSNEDKFSWELHYLAYFEGSVRGLAVDAPVEFRGVQVGRVNRIDLEEAPDDQGLRIAVVLSIQPERVDASARERDEARSGIDRMIENGLRAQLRTGSLVTGQRFVELDIFPDALPAPVVSDADYPVIPTVPGTLDTITTRLSSFLDKLDQLPLSDIADELKQTLEGIHGIVESPQVSEALERLNSSLGHLENLSRQLDRQLVPKATTTLTQATKTLKTAERIISQNSPLHQELLRALKDLSSAARSIRIMAEYLERHPDSLLRGKSSRR